MIGAVTFLTVGALPARAATAPRAEWGATFCSSLGKWSDTITKGATEILSSGSATETSPADGKAIIVAFLDDFAGTTRSFYKRMKKAGNPDTDDGASIQKAILRGIAGIESRIGDLQGLAGALPDTDPVAFQSSLNDLVSAFDTVSVPFDNAMTKVGKLDKDDELSDSLRELKACKQQFG